jgi:hypothetical protein
MAFDPDEYLAGRKTKEFDPDAYIASKKPAAPAPSKPSVWENNPMVNAPGIGPMVKAGYGLMEAGSELGTGIGSQIVGGVGGALTTGYNLLKGKPFDEAVGTGANVVRNVSEAGTYEPKTQEGKLFSKAVSYIPEKLVEGSRWIGGEAGELVGGEKGRIAGEELGGAGMQSLMAVAPVPKLLKKARESAKPTAYEVARETYPARAPEIKQEVTTAAQREAAEAAKRQGVVVDLPDLETGRLTKARRATAREEDVQRVMAEKNKGVPEIKMKEEVGIPLDQPLTANAILASREALAGPKKAIASMEGFLDDGKTVAEIRGLVPERTVGMGKEHGVAVEKVNEIVKDITNGSGSGNWAMSSIESLRKAARDIYGRNDISPELRNTAEIYQGTANALEGLIERRLGTTAPDLLNQYLANRQKMAQTYLLEDVLDQNTHKVNLDRLANQTKNDSSITGAFSDFGKIYANSPESFKPVQKETALTRLSRTTVPGAAGAAFGSLIFGPGFGTAGGIAAGEMIGRALSKRAAAKLASPEHQANYTALRGEPTRAALGYGETPAPLSLAPAGENIPSLPQAAGQAPRTPLDIGFADEVGRRSASPEGIPYEIEPRLNPLYQRGGIDYGPELPPVAREQGMLPPEIPPVLPETPMPRQGFPVLPDDLMGIDEMSLKSRALRDRVLPEGETPLPQLPPREPLDIGFAEVPADMTTKALRTRHDVPTSEFTLRQDFLQQPENVAAIDSFRSQVADLQNKVDNASGFWKQRYQAELDALKQEFYAGMRQIGADTPQQAIGMQNLYEGGGVPRLSIEKAKALRDFQ